MVSAHAHPQADRKSCNHNPCPPWQSLNPARKVQLALVSFGAELVLCIAMKLKLLPLAFKFTFFRKAFLASDGTKAIA